MSYIRNQLTDATKRLHDFAGEPVRVYNATETEDATTRPTWSEAAVVDAVVMTMNTPLDKTVAGGEEVEIDAKIRVSPAASVSIYAADDTHASTVFRHEPDGETVSGTHEWYQAMAVHTNATGVRVVDVKRSEPLNI